MKNYLKIVAVLPLLAVSLPLFAQSANTKATGTQFSQKQLSEMDSKLVRTVKESRDNASRCIRCGRVITEDNQYTPCPQDPDIYCSPDRSNSETQPKDSRYRSNNPNYKGGDPADPANYKTCQWCKQPITDERYGRACPKDPDVHCLPGYDNPNPAPSCYRCGRSFTPGRPCRAKRGEFCATNKKQGRKLKEEARRREEEAAKASRCPKCGEEYNVDVIYHGDPHHCRK